MKITNYFVGVFIFTLLISCPMPLFAEEEKKLEKQEKVKKVEIKKPSKEAKKFNKEFNLQSFNLRPGDFTLTDEQSFIEDREKFKRYSLDLEKQYDKTPDVFNIAIDYGTTLIDLGEYNKAEKVWERAVGAFGLNTTPRPFKAWVDAHKGNYLASKNTWLEVVKSKIGYEAFWFPSEILSLIGLHIIKDNLSEKDRDEVQKVLDLVPIESTLSPRLTALSVTKDLKDGDIQKATEKLTKILTKRPNDPLLLTLLGTRNLILGNYEGALEELNKATKFNPLSPTNHLMKARTLFALNKHKEALAEIDEAIKLDLNWNFSVTDKGKFLSKITNIASKGKN